jgi:secernin
VCDTLVALPSSTASGGVLFGKNSDRERNEAAAVEYRPAARHAAGTTLRCTYIDIPQATETHGAMLCRPYWMWGAEMGANDHGVVIGNEAVHARLRIPRAPALTGMDLLRLGLERGASAAEALDVVIRLLEEFNQGGNCGHLTERYYHNSFIVADAREAFVLETLGSDWVVQRAAAVRSISNVYSIERAYDRISPGLKDLVGDEGATALIDYNEDSRSEGRARCERSTSLLRQVDGHIGVADMQAILRDHGDNPAWHPEDAVRRTICMHAANAERGGQTVNSMVSELIGGRALHWITGTAAPCLSIFKPVLPNRPVTPHGSEPADRFDKATLWWRHELMHRGMLKRFPDHLAAIHAERDAMEASFRDRVGMTMRDGTNADLTAVVDACWTEAEALEIRWAAQANQYPVGRGSYATAWRIMIDLAEMPQPGE